MPLCALRRDGEVTNPTDGTTLSCAELVVAGENGQIEESTCSMAPNFIKNICGCQSDDSEGEATSAPTTTPVTGENPPCNICGAEGLVISIT
jgi:hypothetical protein